MCKARKFVLNQKDFILKVEKILSEALGDHIESLLPKYEEER